MTATSQAEALVGLYGKMPGHGDFVERALPRDFVQPWDGWMQHALAHAKEVLGGRWLEVYLSSPVWRFAISGGVLGSNGWIGLMLPSVDRVGRHFPLLLTTTVPPKNITLQTVISTTN